MAPLFDCYFHSNFQMKGRSKDMYWVASIIWSTVAKDSLLGERSFTSLLLVPHAKKQPSLIRRGVYLGDGESPIHYFGKSLWVQQSGNLESWRLKICQYWYHHERWTKETKHNNKSLVPSHSSFASHHSSLLCSTLHHVLVVSCVRRWTACETKVSTFLIFHQQQQQHHDIIAFSVVCGYRC